MHQDAEVPASSPAVAAADINLDQLSRDLGSEGRWDELVIALVERAASASGRRRAHRLPQARLEHLRNQAQGPREGVHHAAGRPRRGLPQRGGGSAIWSGWPSATRAPAAADRGLRGGGGHGRPTSARRWPCCSAWPAGTCSGTSGRRPGEAQPGPGRRPHLDRRRSSPRRPAYPARGLAPSGRAPGPLGRSGAAALGQRRAAARRGRGLPPQAQEAARSHRALHPGAGAGSGVGPALGGPGRDHLAGGKLGAGAPPARADGDGGEPLQRRALAHLPAGGHGRHPDR